MGKFNHSDEEWLRKIIGEALTADEFEHLGRRCMANSDNLIGLIGMYHLSNNLIRLMSEEERHKVITDDRSWLKEDSDKSKLLSSAFQGEWRSLDEPK